MSDRRTREAAPAYNSMVASAAILAGGRVDKPRNEEWQEEGWGCYDTVGEFRFGIHWQANAMSRLRLGAYQLPDNGSDQPKLLPPNDPASIAVAELAGGVGGQARMMHSISVHLSVPGIGYLVGTDNMETQQREWGVYSARELRLKAARTKTRAPVWEVMIAGSQWKQLPDDTLVCKIWSPHERYHWAPDSPTRAALPILRELVRISDHIDATAISRLAGAGILVLPQEVTFPARPEFKDAPDPFVAELMDVMKAALADRGTAAAVAPLVIKVPAQYVDKIAHLTFATPFDDKVIELRDGAIRRLATSMDFPAEMLLGLGDVNHWGQWQIEETAIKLHIEPKAQIAVHGLTVGYLNPTLEAIGQADRVGEVIVWYDSSELTIKPDRSANTVLGYDRLEVNGKALRRETGLEESDIPTRAELTDMVIKKIVTGENPALVPIALKLLEIDTGEAPATGAPDGGGENPGGSSATQQPDQSAPTVPKDRNPEPPAPRHREIERATALYPVAYRALERAGNRIRTKMRGRLNGSQDCPPEQMHVCLDGISRVKLTVGELLAGSWDVMPVLATCLEAPEPELTAALEEYVIQLLESGQPLELQGLIKAMEGIDAV